MFIEVQGDEAAGHHNNSLHRQRNSTYGTIKIEGVYKELGISTKKKPEIEEEVIEDLSG